MNSSGPAKFVFGSSRGTAEVVFRTSSGTAKLVSGPAFGGPNFLVYIYIYIYTYSSNVPNTTFGTKILMSQFVDHRTTFLDTHSKIPPDSSIYGSKAIVLAIFEPPKSNLQK